MKKSISPHRKGSQVGIDEEACKPTGHFQFQVLKAFSEMYSLLSVECDYQEVADNEHCFPFMKFSSVYSMALNNVHLERLRI